MRLSIVIPALNAAKFLPQTLLALASTLDADQRGGVEIIVADGGSTDATSVIAEAAGALLVTAPRGRGNQLAAGAKVASGDWLLFLHADTRPRQGWHEETSRFTVAPENVMRAAYFRFALDTAARQARTLERRVAWRARVLGLPYGDQGLLISRKHYDAIGGYNAFPLMEDVDLVRRVGRSRLCAIPVEFVTDASKFTGQWRLRSARNLLVLALYFLGAPPRFLRKFY
jgi:rSAM/selenodomain-associated transferase 2